MTAWPDEVRDRILDLLEQGQTLADVCLIEGMPSRKTVNAWIAHDDDYRARYIHARDAGYDARADRMPRTAADEAVDPVTRKLVLETERWLLSKLAPLRYGDRTALQMLDEHGKPAKAGITIIVDGAPGE